MIGTSLKKLGASKRKIAKDIYLISFDDMEFMCRTLLRFAEHYESPKFRNKVFTLKEFKEWYRTTRNGKFTYYQDWGGFNIPAYVFNTFRDKKFNPLLKNEKLFLDVISNLKDRFYIIVTSKRNGALVHETAHGLFYTNEKYRAKVLDILSKINTNSMKKELIKIGYCEDVVLDEINAYSVEGSCYCSKVIPDKATVKKLQKLFNKHLKQAKAGIK